MERVEKKNEIGNSDARVYACGRKKSREKSVGRGSSDRDSGR